MRIQISRAIAGIAISSALGLVAWAQTDQQQPAQPQQPQQQAAQPQQTQEKKPEWKDRAEYDLVQSIDKATDPNEKIKLLDQWREKYPNTDFKDNRIRMYLDAYRALNQPDKMLQTAQELTALDPKNPIGLYWICLLIPSMNRTAPADLDLAEKSAQSLLANLDDFYSAAKKPANVTDEQWKTQRTGFEALGHRTLGWIAMKRSNLPEAENQLASDLKLNPADAEASYWLGTVILAQKKPERQVEALYQFARAAAYDGPGALAPERRKQVQDYVQKAYTTYHGQDPQGFQHLLATAKMSPFPPRDFKILTQDEVAQQKTEQLKQTNPSLALWITIKDALTGAEGANYWEQMKGALVPPEGQPAFRGAVISVDGTARAVKSVVLGVADPKTPDARLNFETPLSGKPEPGKIIEFRGVASSYTKEPFLITFDSEKKYLTGWPAPAPPARKAPARKKNTARRK